MSLELPYGVKALGPVPIDVKYGPYVSVAAAKAAIIQAQRYDGLTVMITGLGEYWWRAANLTDAGLVAKSGSATLNSGMFYWDNALKTYTPYTSLQSFVSFDTSGEIPTNIDNLGINAILRVSGLQVWTSNQEGITVTNSSVNSNAIYVGNDSTGVGYYVDNNGNGTAVYIGNWGDTGSGLTIGNSSTSGHSITLYNSGSGHGIDLNNDGSGNGINITHGSGNGITINTSQNPSGIPFIISAYAINRTILNPNVSNSATAIAYTFDTQNNLIASGAKLISFKKAGVEYLHVDKDGILNKSLSGSSNLPLFNISNAGTQNGAFITNTSSGYGIRIDNTSTGRGSYISNTAGGFGIVIDNISTGTGSYFSNQSTGIGIYIGNASTGTGSYTANIFTGKGSLMNNTSTGIGSQINNTSTGRGSFIDNISSGVGSYITNSSTGQGLFINNTSTGTGSYIGNTSTGRGSYINNSSSGIGSYIDNTSTGKGSHIINISSGIGIYIGNASSGQGSYIDNTSTGTGSYIANSNIGSGIYIDNTSTGRGCTIINNVGGKALSITNKLGGYGIELENRTTGVGSYITNNGTGQGSYINNTSTGTGSYILNQSTGRGSYIGNLSTGMGSQINNTSTGQGLFINNQSTGQGSYIDNTSTGRGSYINNLSTGQGMLIENQSTGTGLLINNTSTGIALKIQDGTTDKTILNPTTANVDSAVAYTFNTKNALTATYAKHTSWQDAGTEIMVLSQNGLSVNKGMVIQPYDDVFYGLTIHTQDIDYTRGITITSGGIGSVGLELICNSGNALVISESYNGDYYALPRTVGAAGQVLTSAGVDKTLTWVTPTEYTGFTLPYTGTFNDEAAAFTINVDEGIYVTGFDVNLTGSTYSTAYSATVDNGGTGLYAKVTGGYGVAIDLVTNSAEGLYINNIGIGRGIQVNNNSTGKGIQIDNTSTAEGLRINNTSTGKALTISNGSSTYTLPSSVGTSGQVLTSAGNNGTLTWVTPAAYEEFSLPYSDSISNGETGFKIDNYGASVAHHINNRGTSSTGIYINNGAGSEATFGKKGIYIYDNGYLNHAIYVYMVTGRGGFAFVLDGPGGIDCAIHDDGEYENYNWEKGIILRSENGTRHRLRIGNDGDIFTSVVVETNP